MKHCSLFFFIIVLVSCATPSHICDPDQAREAGRAQALNGWPLEFSQGKTCTDNLQTSFRKNFEAGYQNGKAEFCNPQELRIRARKQAESGESYRFKHKNFTLCDSKAALESAYKEGFAEGLQTFCSPAKLYEEGIKAGQSGKKERFSAEIDRRCPTKTTPNLRKPYLEGYKFGLTQYCDRDSIRKIGMGDGSEGRRRTDIVFQYRICGEQKANSLKSDYEVGYQDGLRQFCNSDKLEDQARQDAESASQFKLPASFSLCFAKDPSRVGQYKTIFDKRRSEILRTECSFERGLEKGRKDADTTNQKRSELPIFCDPSAGTSYMNGYLDGWNGRKKDICDFAGAHAEGINRAKNGLSATYTPPLLCPEEFKEQVQQKFMDGYRSGTIQR